MSPGSFGLGFSGALGEITRTTAGVLEAAAKGICFFCSVLGDWTCCSYNGISRMQRCSYLSVEKVR